MSSVAISTKAVNAHLWNIRSTNITPYSDEVNASFLKRWNWCVFFVARHISFRISCFDIIILFISDNKELWWTWWPYRSDPVLHAMSLLTWHSVRQSTYPSIIHTDITQHDGFMSPCNTPLWCWWFTVAPLLNKEQGHHEFSYDVKLLISVYILSFRLSWSIKSRVSRTYHFTGKILGLRICQLLIYMDNLMFIGPCIIVIAEE